MNKNLEKIEGPTEGITEQNLVKIENKDKGTIKIHAKVNGQDIWLLTINGISFTANAYYWNGEIKKIVEKFINRPIDRVNLCS